MSIDDTMDHGGDGDECEEPKPFSPRGPFWISWTRNPVQVGEGCQNDFEGKLHAGTSSETIADASETQLEFLDLRKFSPEIRAMIWREVLEPRPEIQTDLAPISKPAFYYPATPSKYANPRYGGIRCGARNVRLLETCKWIHAEAAELLYRETKFTFKDHWDCLCFFGKLSQKYLDLVKHIGIMDCLSSKGSENFPVLRNLKSVSIPMAPDLYHQAKAAKKAGLLLEEMNGIQELLVLRGLTSIVLIDVADIPKYYPELVAIKKKVDALITKSVTRPRKIYGGPESVSMDSFNTEHRRLYIGDDS